jgi:predicted metalloprotease with PDZ domain
LQVELSIQAPGKFIDFSLPAWAPGSYAIANYAKYVQDFSAHNAAGEALAWEKIDKQTWRISGYAAPQRLTVSYRIYADVLSDTQSEFNDEHAHVFNPQVFICPANMKEQPVRLVIHRPPFWRIATGLEALNDSTFAAPNYDVFIDAPFEIGEFSEARFEAAGAQFRLIVHGETESWRIQQFVEKLQKIVAEEIAMMGGAPVREYVFCWHVDPRADYYGLEHLNSTCIGMPHQLRPNGNRRELAGLRRTDAGRYRSRLCGARIFHLWNVKRIRPIELGPFDYTRKSIPRVYGLARHHDYYSYLTLVRCGLWSSVNGCKIQQHHQPLSPRQRLEASQRTRVELDVWLWNYEEGDQGNLRQTYFPTIRGDLIGWCWICAFAAKRKTPKASTRCFAYCCSALVI